MLNAADPIKNTIEYRCLTEILDRVETCDPSAGAGYRRAMEDCLTGLASGRVSRAEANEQLEQARECLLRSAKGQVLRLRLENLVEAIGTVLLDQLLDEAADLGRKVKVL